MEGLAIYLRDISEMALLDKETEKELAHAAQKGDMRAREEIVRSNLRLVVKIARGYAPNGRNLDDFIGEGNLGLLRAVKAFKPSLNVPFSNYAAFWIKDAMTKFLSQGKAARVPRYLFQLLRKWTRATAELQSELGRAPTEDEVAARLTMSPNVVRLIRKGLQVYNGGPTAHKPGLLLNEIANPRLDRPDDKAMQVDELHQVLRYLAEMDNREQTVLRMRFGLIGEEPKPKTLLQIGECLGLTRERVRQIEQQALANLRDKVLPKET